MKGKEANNGSAHVPALHSLQSCESALGGLKMILSLCTEISTISYYRLSSLLWRPWGAFLTLKETQLSFEKSNKYTIEEIIKFISLLTCQPQYTLRPLLPSSSAWALLCASAILSCSAAMAANCASCSTRFFATAADSAFPTAEMGDAID